MDCTEMGKMLAEQGILGVGGQLFMSGSTDSLGCLPLLCSLIVVGSLACNPSAYFPYLTGPGIPALHPRRW